MQQRAATAGGQSMSDSCGFWRSRRGISPLIATVLLLAFAVAIGTMAVSYILEATKTSLCDGVEIALEGSPNVCWANNRASFIIVNRAQSRGDEPLLLASLGIRFVDAAQTIDERKIEGLSLAQGSATKIDLEYKSPNPNGTRVKIIPGVKEKGDIVLCPQRELVTIVGSCT